jgi:hypothetical protein
MQKPTSSKSSSKSSTTSKPARPHLPDPATEGPYRPFTTDPKWNEAWWWLGVPVLVLARADRGLPDRSALVHRLDHP